MLKRIFIGLICLCCTVPGLGAIVRNGAQKRQVPDLRGTWKLDRSKGNYARYSGLKPDADLLLIVSQAGPEIKVNRKSLWRGQEHVREATYYSDGRGEVASTFLGNSQHKSKSAWEGDKFVTRFPVTSPVGPEGSVTFEVTQEWKLSTDGQTLTQTERKRRTGSTRMEDPILRDGFLLSPGEIKRVFNRIP